jgi:hypothetical protein
MIFWKIYYHTAFQDPRLNDILVVSVIPTSQIHTSAISFLWFKSLNREHTDNMVIF